MTKYVYVVNKFDMEPWEHYHDGIHKVFSTEEAAIAYVKENDGKVFPEKRDPWDSGWAISTFIRKMVLEE